MEAQMLRKIRYMVIFFMFALAASGITAFPVYTELSWMQQHGYMTGDNFIGRWLSEVYAAVADTQAKYPFIFYGFDWLAFAHLMIAAVFYGVYKDPVRNRFIVNWGMFCCVCIVPLALICGSIRGIPFYHQLIDCSFGVFGIVPLLICKRWIGQLEKLQNKNQED